MASSDTDVVCVTGANGFIGSWIVQTLLQNPRYTSIHASVFPKSNFSHLFHLHPSAESKIKIFLVDVLDAEALARAIHGCSGVFHVASPCTLEDPLDPQQELVLSAVQGTRNVLEAAKKNNVNRVVITSSISAIVPNPNWPPNRVFDESSWTDLDYCKSRGKWYPVSKTLAERGAWEYARENGVDMVVINPGTCLGGLLQDSLNASSAVLKQLLEGSEDTQEYHWLGAVHVKDVARAHVLLFESPNASGRYLCTNGVYQFSEFANRVAKMYPEFPVHRFPSETQPGLVACENAAKRLIDLGLEFTPLEDAVGEAVDSLISRGFLKLKS